MRDDRIGRPESRQLANRRAVRGGGIAACGRQVKRQTNKNNNNNKESRPDARLPLDATTAKTTNGSARPARHLHGLYVDEFRRNIQLPKGMTHLYERIYERGMEMSDTESSARMLMVPRGKRPGDASHISVADLDALANGLDA